MDKIPGDFGHYAGEMDNFPGVIVHCAGEMDEIQGDFLHFALDFVENMGCFWEKCLVGLNFWGLWVFLWGFVPSWFDELGVWCFEPIICRVGWVQMNENVTKIMKKRPVPIEELEKSIKLWLKKNELEGDVSFYKISEWIKRKEDYNNDSDLVMVLGSGFGEILNGYYGESEIENSFEDLVESFGYYFELGNSWNGGFYRIPEYDDNWNIDKSYEEKLKDFRWQEKRKKILTRAGNQCEDCGKKGELHVHHTYYKYPYNPWQYPLDALRSLCPDCHEKRGEIELLFRAKLSNLTHQEIQKLINLFDHGMYWYKRDYLFDFINHIGYDETKMKQKFDLMLATKASQ